MDGIYTHNRAAKSAWQRRCMRIMRNHGGDPWALADTVDRLHCAMLWTLALAASAVVAAIVAVYTTSAQAAALAASLKAI